MPRRRSSKSDPTDPETVRARALRALARREHGARELQRKLVQGGAPEALAAEVVQNFIERGWQSDQRYAESLARTRIAQAYGPLRLRAELEAAGIAQSVVDAVVVEPDESGWAALARQAYQRRFAAPPATPDEWQKGWRFLAQRGFASDDIRAVLRNRQD